MRWIFRYNEVAAKYLGKLTKTKMKVEPQPWLHVAVKTMSERNPWSGYVIYIWDTRQIVGEYRSNKGLFRTNMFTKEASGMSRAVDNRQPLVGGRKDVNEFFEFGKFDASHSEIFDADGKRIENTPLYNRRAKKAGVESSADAKEKVSKLVPDIESEFRKLVDPVNVILDRYVKTCIPKWKHDNILNNPEERKSWEKAIEEDLDYTINLLASDVADDLMQHTDLDDMVKDLRDSDYRHVFTDKQLKTACTNISKKVKNVLAIGKKNK